MATNDITQASAEVLFENPSADAAATQVALEVIITFGQNYVTQISTEIVTGANPHADVCQLLSEVVMDSLPPPSPPVKPTIVTKPLTLVDTWELDHGYQNWPGEYGTPIAWWENTLQQQQIALAPTPGDIGTIGLLYVALAQLLSNTGVAFTIPDDWTPYIVWKALADLFGADGQSYDPLRAQYCQRRYDEGVELARLVIGGNE